jgi:hypothetical protein
VLLFEVVRREPKDFRQRRPDGDGGWIWKLEDTRRVLYRLPEVVAAEEVWFVEGEKDADSLAVAGLCGTTSPQGAKFWRDELAAPLAGKRVVVLPDNDDAGRRHAQTVAAAARTARRPASRCLELPGLPPKGDVSDWLAAGHGADELRAMMAAAPEWEPWEAEADEAADTRPLIRIRGGELHRHVEAAAEALGSASRAHPFEGVYRRGTLLVRPGRVESGAEPERAGLRRAPGTLTILTVSTDYLTLALTRCARWEKFDGRAKAGVPANAPENVAAALASASDQLLPIPMLAGIVEAPTIRADGTLLDRPGYDPATRLLFDPGGVEFPPIPESPTREEAEAALALLREPLAEFPFAGEGSETVILSQILTALVRKSMRAAPLHLVTAPTMASGKTLLATIGGYVATGRAPAMMSQATDPAEERKRLLALLLEGSPMVVVDNIERPLESDALCSILTEPLFTDRVLGMSRTATAPTNALFVATGNNATVAGDLTTRTIAATLDAKVERPEERRFRLNLHEWVPANRGRLVAAALTIIRGYIAAGEPRSGKLPNFARFEDWTRRVREPLTWLGMEDPCKGRERVEGRDPVRAQLGGLIAAWHENYPGCAATTAEAVRLATREPTMAEAEADTAARARLRDAIAEVASGRNGVSPGSLGKFIAKHEGRFEGGLRFEKKGVSHQAALWAVTAPPLRETPGSLGSLGSLANPYAGKCQRQRQGQCRVTLS